ncbi:MAG: glutamate synthase large subunit [spirochete symbiont of Stewartia floridana]|nr:MAG: glutamate synthase large subunit [spirochete symbiont of Stewartia floridana]
MLNAHGLYDPKQEHDACGVGFVVKIDGEKSHDIIEKGVEILCNLEHRGAVGGDQKTGDGAGMLIQLPHRFLKRVCSFTLPDEGMYGAGMIFLPFEEEKRAIAIDLTEKTCGDEGWDFLGWREVPINPDCLGEMARRDMPHIRQFIVKKNGLTEDALERELYILRKCLIRAGNQANLTIEEYYIPSLSHRTMVYKGMFVARQFLSFYPDLAERDMISALALVHQRYSTNTFPSWPLAHPYRYIAHNGEFNTIRRNLNTMYARQASLSSELFGENLQKLYPISISTVSDSAVFDNVFELLVQSGREMEHAMMMMIPEPFGAKYHMSEDKRAFYEYHAAIMEPWDGPAVIAFTDGERIGATLDRNGLRPGRYTVTKDGLVVMASEAGVIDIAPANILEKGRLAPGKIFVVDIKRGRIVLDNEVKSHVSRRQPYRRWLSEYKIELSGLLQAPRHTEYDPEKLSSIMRTFGYSYEDIRKILIPMATNAQEPVGSMGNDSPVPVLSRTPVLLYDYFRQQFAQVTNPPIDPYRENLVMSLMSFIGREGNLLTETPAHCRQLKLAHPVLTNDDIKYLRDAELDDFKVVTISLLMTANGSDGILEEKLTDVCAAVENKIDEGASLVILSDRGIDKNHMAIPALLAVSAVHHHLIQVGKRHLAGLILESGEGREVHHFATLVGFGCSGINPYLVFDALSEMRELGFISADISLQNAMERYITAVKKGLLKVMSKMGISTLRSYRGAQMFEAVGISQNLIDKYFRGTESRVGGLDMAALERDIRIRHGAAWAEDDVYNDKFRSGSAYSSRVRNARHLFNDEAVITLQRAVREGDYQIYKEYSAVINDKSRGMNTLRGLFSFRKGQSIPLSQVESASEIVRRFTTGAMSFGSLSREAHETIAIAMNGLGARSNSGEGGEDETRYTQDEDGTDRKSYTKQIASGRFGVNAAYLANCNELQIKMAQGAKPGEGGQLPGHKVNEEIARVRFTTPGVMLISPPPHHDIYSIEDLSQLIYDLKNANPNARVSVKLVSEYGVGTVAAGVAKGKADMVLISGCDGGTGASPLSSIKHAGTWWELGLAETQQVLVMNKLRSRIRVQTDGQLKTGRDTAIAALLGAEEFGFGTTSLVAIGCVMMRACHTNACPVGITTQNPELRGRFPGKPEHLQNFMLFVAEELREIMAELGFKTIEDMVGRADMLEVDEAIEHYKAKGLDFSKILAMPNRSDGEPLHCTDSQSHDLSLALDPALVKDSAPAIERGEKIILEQNIRNCHRTVGATLSYHVTQVHGSAGLPDDTITVQFRGSAGQSFGAFLTRGITFRLIGEANDYFGKGLSGGRLILYPTEGVTYSGFRNIITGNVNLFGATGGEAFINGMAGERFCVRNSGATAVVEGVGDHGCEYMTGGIVVVLGRTGVNFAAGMSGGIAFVYDGSQLFDTRCNLEMVDIEPVMEDEDIGILRRLIQRHTEYTDSLVGKRIIGAWEESLPRFVKVMPIEYKRALENIRDRETQNTDTTALTEEVFV